MNCGFGASVMVDGCTLNGNSSISSAGGAIALQNDLTSVVVLNSMFNDNKANNNGGAIFTGASTSSSNVAVDNSEFWTNEVVTGSGGAISCAENGPVEASLTLSNSLFGYNVSPGQAGAVNLVDVDATITSCVFFNNLANGVGTGGAISNNASDSNHVEVLITNSTFADNFGILAGGIADWTGLNEATSNMTIQNCIFRQDGAINYAIEDGIPALISSGGNLSDDQSMAAALTHPKDIQLEDPDFVDPDDFDFRLKDGSICIDAGVDAGAPALDLDGNPRVGPVDMGAYENQTIVNVRENLLENDGLLAVSPNPVTTASAKAVLQNDWKGELQIRLFDVAGRTLKTVEITKTGERLEFELSLEGVKTGVYELVVSNGTHAVAARLVRM